MANERNPIDSLDALSELLYSQQHEPAEKYRAVCQIIFSVSAPYDLRLGAVVMVQFVFPIDVATSILVKTAASPESAELRDDALRALGEIGGNAAAAPPELLRMAADTAEPDELLVRALRSVAPEDVDVQRVVRSWFERLANNPDSDWQHAVASGEVLSLATIDDITLEKLVHRLRRPEQAHQLQALHALRSIGPLASPATEAVRACLRSDVDSLVHCVAVTTLGEICTENDKAVFNDLVKILNTGKRDLAESAVLAISSGRFPALASLALPSIKPWLRGRWEDCMVFQTAWAIISES